MTKKNTGIELENIVCSAIKKTIDDKKFIVEQPYVLIEQHKKYYSKDRNDYITTDISIEKYLENPKINSDVTPSLIIIIECKDYKSSIPVDDVEEFYSKLQQIGAHKGIIFTRHGSFQKSALTYAESKRIGLAKIIPEELTYLMHSISTISTKNKYIEALTDSKFMSNSGNFFCSDGIDDFDDYLNSFIDL